jgi:hypothetical protein
MYRCHSQPWRLLPIIAVGIIAYWLATGKVAPSPIDREAMIGTWTDETGEPGNSISFYLVPVDMPTSPVITGSEGRATICNLLGEKLGQAIWNYGSWDPLVLNINVGTQSWYAVIRKLDDEHILVRFGRDPSEIMRPGAIDHPDTKRLTRIGRE